MLNMVQCTSERPRLIGYADEEGVDAGHGYNVNVPLPAGTGVKEYLQALQDTLER